MHSHSSWSSPNRGCVSRRAVCIHHSASTRVGVPETTGSDPNRTDAPAERPSFDGPLPDGDQSMRSPLGSVPHQIRGSLSQWNNSVVEGAAYDRCTACSSTVRHVSVGSANRRSSTRTLIKACRFSFAPSMKRASWNAQLGLTNSMRKPRPLWTVSNGKKVARTTSDRAFT